MQVQQQQLQEFDQNFNQRDSPLPYKIAPKFKATVPPTGIFCAYFLLFETDFFNLFNV